MIHPGALVDASARIAAGVDIGAFAVVEADVEVGPGCRISDHAVLRRGTVLEAEVAVDSFCVLGGLPQDLKFDPATISGVRIGARTVLREGVVVHRATRAGGETRIGADSLLMCGSHAGHDAVVGDRVILGSHVLLAGFVTVGDRAILSGGAAVHQHGRVGESAMVAGLSRISVDVPPFCLVSERNRLHGLNQVGLTRQGLPRASIRELKALLRELYAGGSPTAAAVRLLEAGTAATPEGRRLLEFFSERGRGFSRPTFRAGGAEADP
ncbi:MAG: acyl-ACP--UDP-N-acetylglucosamine O-acyltransferase [Puniceicoccaceae bacterium]|nr:MAG: acyl-ACP--UDP-N-acetylglucosamine O-acyltransferase [Puniceicoccaceae bacterium]